MRWVKKLVPTHVSVAVPAALECVQSWRSEDAIVTPVSQIALLPLAGDGHEAARPSTSSSADDGCLGEGKGIFLRLRILAPPNAGYITGGNAEV
jgi:hypothetical protein